MTKQLIFELSNFNLEKFFIGSVDITSDLIMNIKELADFCKSIPKNSKLLGVDFSLNNILRVKSTNNFTKEEFKLYDKLDRYLITSNNEFTFDFDYLENDPHIQFDFKDGEFDNLISFTSLADAPGIEFVINSEYFNIRILIELISEP